MTPLPDTAAVNTQASLSQQGHEPCAGVPDGAKGTADTTGIEDMPGIAAGQGPVTTCSPASATGADGPGSVSCKKTPSSAVMPPASMGTPALSWGVVFVIGSVVLSQIVVAKLGPGFMKGSHTYAWGFGVMCGQTMAVQVMRANHITLQVVQSICHVSLFVLVGWLLSRDPTRHRLSRTMKALIVILTTLRMWMYGRFSIFAPPEFRPIFRVTWSYPIFGIFISDSMLLQALWHRVLPDWACDVLGCMHALLLSILSYRLTSGDMGLRRLLHIFLTPQVGVCAVNCFMMKSSTYNVIRRTLGLRESSNTPPASHAVPNSKATSKQGKLEDGTIDSMTVPSSSKDATASEAFADFLPDLSVKVKAGPSSGMVCQAAAAASGSVPVDDDGTTAMPGSPGVASPGARAALTAAILQAQYKPEPYRSRLLVPHMICVKLDTDQPLSSLSPAMAQRLQDVIASHIADAASMSIATVAARSGCVCITMKVEEHQREPAGQGVRATARVSTQQVAHALLPELQNMLSTENSSMPFQRAAVQLDDNSVLCFWNDTKQTWELLARPVPCSGSEADKPWLGVATASGLKAAAATDMPSMATAQQDGWLDVVTEVQVWGVTKATDLEGWVRPQQHHWSIRTEPDWLSLAPEAASQHPLELLAHCDGCYLPTRVVRLVQAARGCVNAQVLVRLHEQQLTRHHTGGVPSTLLQIDMELWRNELLLSSSALLCVPAASPAASASPAPVAWWWGSRDRTVAAALSELDSGAQACRLAADHSLVTVAGQGTSAFTRTYVGYVQDLTLWLAQVQRLACSSGLCQCKPTEVSINTQDAQLHQPILELPALRQLATDLQRYAKQVGWQQVHHMISQQMRSVVQPASLRLQHTGQCSWVASGMRALRPLLLGYPCRLDEQLYQQRLAATHMSGVLIVSNTASVLSTLICAAHATRNAHFCGGVVVFVGMLWALIHMVAIASALWTRSSKTPTGQGSLNVTPFPLRLVTWAYLWRVVSRMAMAVGFSRCFSAIYRSNALLLPVQLFVSIVEQMQAIATLSAACMMAITLCVELPAVVKAAPYKPLAVPFLLLARLALDAYMRSRLTSPTQAKNTCARMKID